MYFQDIAGPSGTAPTYLQIEEGLSENTGDGRIYFHPIEYKDE